AIADAPGGISHHGECGEAELPATFHHLGGAVDRDELLDELICRLPLLWSCHMSVLPRIQAPLHGPHPRAPSRARGTETRNGQMPPCSRRPPCCARQSPCRRPWPRSRCRSS